jgi:hypothetical protein
VAKETVTASWSQAHLILGRWAAQNSSQPSAISFDLEGFGGKACLNWSIA